MGFKKVASDSWKFITGHKWWFIGSAATLTIAGVLLTGLAFPGWMLKKNEQPQEPVKPTTSIEIVIDRETGELVALQGTGNEKYINEANRNEVVSYFLSNEKNVETGLDESYASMYVTYTYEKTLGEGDAAQKVKMSTTKELKLLLNEEQVNALNVATSEEVPTLVCGYFTAEDAPIVCVNEPIGMNIDDDSYYALCESIKEEIAKSDEYVGFDEENTTVVVTDVFNSVGSEADGTSPSLNIAGYVVNGENKKYFNFVNPYSTLVEYKEDRKELNELVDGASIIDCGFTLMGASDAELLMTSTGVNGETKTKTGVMVVSRVQKEETITEPTK